MIKKYKFPNSIFFLALLVFLHWVNCTKLQAQTIPFVSRTGDTFPSGKLESFLGAAGIGKAPDGDSPNVMGLGWLRTDVSWADKNPALGVYDWNAKNDIDQLILDANTKGMKVLLMVRNTPAWAATTEPYEFDTPGKNGIAQGEHWIVTPTIDTTSGYASGYRLQKISNADSSIISDTTSTRKSALRIKNSEDFVTFMLELIGRYSVEPYNVKFYQIANEHRPESGQYPLDQPSSVAERWFVPAAKAIHANFPGVKVMNCWPTNATESQIKEFDSVPGVLENLDIYAQHYGGAIRWPVVWDRYDSLGVKDIAFWATEFGSVLNNGGPGGGQFWKIAHDYPDILGMCLKRQWENDDKFKVFWWPYSSSSSLEKTRSLVKNGDILTSHGEQLRTIYSLLYGETLELTSDFSITPNPEASDYLWGFKTDRGIVFAIGMKDWNGGNELKITLTKIAPGAISVARSVSPDGTVLQDIPLVDNNGGTEATVDLSLLEKGEQVFFVEFYVDVSTTITDEPFVQPRQFRLFQNFPNPFNPSTLIQFSLPEDESTTLTVYDIKGRVIRTLVNTRLEKGEHSVVFDGSGLPSGVYFYNLTAGAYSETKKLLFMK